MESIGRLKSMVLHFRGCAHPPPGHSDYDIANLSAAEISTTDLGRNGGTPLLLEHDSGKVVGRCDASWEGPKGELRVAGIITDARTESDVRSGRHRGLSLGTDVIQDEFGTPLYKGQAELSVCHEPRRRGSYIDTVDGQAVHTKRHFSQSASLASLTLISFVSQ